jgi:threonyl-tRNA synthetase
MERMVAHLLDTHGAALPPWIAPVQVVLAPFAASADEDCATLHRRFCELGIRAQVWDSDASVSTRVRRAAHLGVPWLGVIGDRERQNAAIAVRPRGQDTHAVTMPIDDFVATVVSVVERRSPGIIDFLGQ